MKPIWQSKTFWFNVVTAAAAFLAMPQITAVIDPQTLLIIQAAINILLRIVSTQAVSMTGAKS